MRKRLALAPLLGTAAVLVGAGPALAGPPSVTVSSPANGAALSSAAPQINGSASATAPGGTITGSLSLTITSSAGHPGWSSSVPSWCGQSACSFTVSVNPGLAYNGQYQLSVTAQETDPPLSTTRSASWSGGFSVAVPPVSPQNVSATPASDGSSITLSWSANPEPDIVGYQVERSPTSASWPQAVTGTELVDSAVSPGHSYTYTVTAVRQGASSGSVLYSSPTSAAATDPTVTDAGPGTSGSGSGSTATGSGSSAGSTSSGSGSTSAGSTGSAPTSGSGSSSTSRTSGQPSLGTYGKAGSSSSGGSHNLSSFDQLVKKTAAQQSTAGGSSAQGVDGAALSPLTDGVAPGSDNPEVAPFSSGSSQAQTEAGGSTTVSYTSRVENHQAVVSDFAAVGLAALLLAVVAHLLWLRRAVSAAP